MAEDPKEVLRRSRALLQAERASKAREELLEKLPQGHGSGLDADTVDGLHASEIISKGQAAGGGGGSSGSGSGDMTKTVYDQDENGVVDNSEKLDGKTVAEVQDHDPKTHTHPVSELTGHDKAVHDGLGINAAALEGSSKAQVQDHTPKAHTHPISELTDHDKTTHDGLGIDAATLEGSTKAQVRDHTPQVHGNEVHDPDMATVTELSTHVANQDAHHTKFTTVEHDVTARHTLGTVVQHDSLASLTEKSHTTLTDKGTNTHTQIDTHLGAVAPHSGHEQTANKGAASGYAPLDVSSKVPTVNLGGAGADNTKFLRGDQTWQVPPTGGGVAWRLAATWGLDVTKSNIGTSFVNCYTGYSGKQELIDFTGFTLYRVIYHVNKVGTGTQTWRLLESNGSDVMGQIDDTASAGEHELDTGWLSLPAWAVNEKKVRPQGKSTVAGDDPVFRGCHIYLK